MTTTSNETSLESSLMQPWLEEFDQIREFFDEEVHSSVQRLCSDNSFLNLLTEFFTQAQTNPGLDSLSATLRQTLRDLNKVSSIKELQLLANKIASPIIENSITHLSFSGLDHLSTDSHYLFISNHRDILMDPLLLNVLLHKHQHNTAHCAIGDNLLKNNIALEFALLNKCFKILRSITSPREILKAMKLQSAYIRHLSFNRASNIWIAQKEGRSKDNLDKTNPALIKMLGLAKPKETPFGEYIDQLKIVPVSFSYEWDPCDIDKATELEITERQGHYQKQAIEDLTAVKKGLFGSKGRVHVHFGSELLGGKLKELNHTEIADCIDKSILQNRLTFPVNYAAKGALSTLAINTPTFQPLAMKTRFSSEDIDEAARELERRLKDCTPEVRRRVLLNYAAHSVD
ncbi:1-acyl-sn-glycerol-3-phosphate acyltransferase [Alkalimarinus alittae]|uniref:1-acyl-sn-glycerol-3-phosphate acyltransferase n=1 Tax=Alkalimarinus alittae TaxID=2961619 RepID=A0ABY6MZ66_9ALTE|nr:1-acyl-sn-glycerol-3-phosphate acyltransferase [Alkalimarinus alittae]UZE95072.1 1-acyl-sn-glycerol-3-phosphate acyltransferase [Alkalimarinus alittae]